MGSATSTMSAAVPPAPPPTGTSSSFTPPASAGLPPRPTNSVPLGPRNDGLVDISALRAAAMRSAKGKAPVRDNGSRDPFKPTSFPQSTSQRPLVSPPSVTSLMGTSSRAGPSRDSEVTDRRAAEIEKEEGEISDEDEISDDMEKIMVAEMLGGARGGPSLQAAESEDRSIGRVRRPPSPSAYPSRSNAPSPASSRRRSSSFVGPSSAVLSSAPSRSIEPSISATSGNVIDAPSLDNPVLPQPPNEMTPAEVRQYRSILLEILHKGVSPEALIRRGVGAHHVIAICEEIVNGQQRRRELWLETREPKDRLRGESEQPPGTAVLARQAARMVQRRSSSPEVEVLVRMDRAESHSSETSAEREMFEKSPPPAVPLRLRPSSSWTPDQTPPVAPARPTAVPSNVRIDSYKPDEVRWRYRSPAKSLSPQPPSLSFASTSAASAAIPSSSGARPSPLPLDRSRDISSGSKESIHPPPVSTPTGPRAMRSASLSPDKPSIPLPQTANLQAAPSPSLSASPLAAQHPTATSRETLSETRRKLLESMKLRRMQAKPPNSTPGPQSVYESSSVRPAPATAILQESVDAFMADMEREIVAQQAGDVESAMDIDSVEEGEISSPDEKDNPVTLAVREKFSDQASRSSALSSHSSRGIKRPTAEDLEDRPMTVSQRFVPPSKRRVFGGVPQRPQRLLINLDDDSDSDDDDTDGGATSRSVDIEAARMLAEKEDSIRRLKEQIAARLKARELKRLQAAVAGESSRSGSETPGDKAALAAEQEALRVAEADVAAAHVVTSEQAVTLDEDTSMDDDSGARDSAHSNAVPSIEIDAPDTSAINGHQVSPIPDPDPNVATATGFLPYRSLIKRYPLLTPDMSSTYSYASPAKSPSPTLSTPDPPTLLSHVDHDLLGNIVLTNRLQTAPSAVICAAEAAGGTCADPACADLHLSRSTDPTDRDLVEYVALKISGVSQARIAAAIKAVRSHHQSTGPPGASRGIDEMLGKIGALLEGFRSPAHGSA